MKEQQRLAAFYGNHPPLYTPSMSLLAFLFTLAAIGISETAYLVKARKAHERPVCFLGGKCAVALKSKYNHLLLVPNDALGLLFYLVTGGVLALLVIGAGPAPLLVAVLRILLLVGSIMSVVLTVIQWRVLRAWCSWCVLSALTIWIMGAFFLAHALLAPHIFSPVL